MGRYGNMLPKECCGTCVFFRRREGTQFRSFRNGKCVRFPPQPILDRFAHPDVLSTDWCGEWSDTEHRRLPEEEAT